MPAAQELYRFGIRTEEETVEFAADPGPEDDAHAGESPMDRALRIANAHLVDLAGPSALSVNRFAEMAYGGPPSDIVPIRVGKARFWRLP
jgi:hypothetical protein